MSGFDLLHPIVQHHIANSLGWGSLRPFQNEVIPDLLAGNDMVILAPTAGGKTEAAFFPVASRILSDSWRGLSVVYVCPLRALLNNLNERLQRYCRLLGMSAGLWHGDISTTDRNAILRDHPSLLLTTPESLEVMLLSDRVNNEQFFGNVRAVIVDEIHAFAGDDRGWHLQSVLSRICVFANQQVQRIGLSATVGNPQFLLDWLSPDQTRPKSLYSPATARTDDAVVEIDFVGSLGNAAKVISRLYHGMKRLVFLDNRSKVEELGQALKEIGVQTFVTHSSLSVEQRREAERAFSSGSDCIIVATSVLELGIDVGDLDRVIQVDSPGSVAGFLQRMGRTGRRPGTARRCLFLATSDEALLTISALVQLWKSGYVEPVKPPVLPWHILAQQIMAILLQERGVTKHGLRHWLRNVAAFAEIDEHLLSSVLDWMEQQEVLWRQGDLYWFGVRGDAEYGRRNFFELFSVFVSPPEFEVRHGRQKIGTIDDTLLLARSKATGILLLGGYSWQIIDVDWKRRIVHVDPIKQAGESRWSGGGRVVDEIKATEIRRLLSSNAQMSNWTRRATTRMDELRSEIPDITMDASSLMKRKNHWEWYTFAGSLANACLTNKLESSFGLKATSNPIAISIHGSVSPESIHQMLCRMKDFPPEDFQPTVDEESTNRMKFADCLPASVSHKILVARCSDTDAVRRCLDQKIQLLPSLDSSTGQEIVNPD